LPQALADLDASIRCSPRYVPAYLMRAHVYLAARQPALAVADYDRAIALDPASAEAWCARALCHYAVKNYPQARADLAECVRLGGRPDPRFVEALESQR
jgi:tetratricopeptide (TPR) repeat protein